MTISLSTFDQALFFVLLLLLSCLLCLFVYFLTFTTLARIFIVMHHFKGTHFKI